MTKSNVGRFKHWTKVVVWGGNAPVVPNIWDDDDDWIISMSGWRIGTTDGMWCIMREPNASVFRTDAEASDFVYKQAAKGSDIHKRAIACVAARNMGITS
jgi:hypothetical protein